MKILLIEDERDLADVTARWLRESGMCVDVETDGESGLQMALALPYDTVVLDLMLPARDGWSVLRQLRAERTTPVLVLTARGAVADRVRGLNEGADDYLAKPFDFDELVARIRALVRRSAGQPCPIIRVRDVEVDLRSCTARRAGRPVALTPKEYALLELLVLRRGSLVPRRDIYQHIYEEQDDTLSNVVDVYVANLRRKLGAELIETRRGQGYIIRE